MSPLLGMDYGLSRIGLAISDESESIALVLGTHHRHRDGSFLTYIKEMIKERNITGLVLGLPLTADGKEGEMAARVREFAQKVTEATRMPVILVDERYSSQEAARQLQYDGNRRPVKEDVDAVSAQIILQQYLDSRQKSESPSEAKPS